MAKSFDASAKQLIEADPLAWLHFCGLPGERVELINTDLSTVEAAADCLMRVHNPDRLAHIEAQASYKTYMDNRTLFHNVVAFYKNDKNDLPVDSVIILMRKEADGPAITGKVKYGKLTFEYDIIRIWKKKPKELLNGALALLPFAPLTDVSQADLPAVVQEIERRIEAEAPEADKGMLQTTTLLLMGLKHDPAFARALLKGVRTKMQESSTYQDILREGREEGVQIGEQKGIEKGRSEEAHRLLLIIGGRRFGEPDEETQAALNALTSPEQIEQLAIRMFEIESWQELLNQAG